MNKTFFKSCLNPFTRFQETVSKWLSDAFIRLRRMNHQTCSNPLCPAGIFALAKLPCGVCATVKALHLAHDEAEKLRRIGIREGGRISMISQHDPMLVLVENTRIALSHRLAPQVHVQSHQDRMHSGSGSKKEWGWPKNGETY